LTTAHLSAARAARQGFPEWFGIIESDSIKSYRDTSPRLSPNPK
jgi:hypothetical protein